MPIEAKNSSVDSAAGAALEAAPMSSTRLAHVASVALSPVAANSFALNRPGAWDSHGLLFIPCEQRRAERGKLVE